jgi:hypothetical protein
MAQKQRRPAPVRRGGPLAVPRLRSGSKAALLSDQTHGDGAKADEDSRVENTKGDCVEEADGGGGGHGGVPFAVREGPSPSLTNIDMALSFINQITYRLST